MLESALKEQLKGIFAGLEANFAFDISVSSSHENRAELLELLGDVADCSDHITYSVNEGNGLKFTLLKNGNATGITFRGIPNGHEFTSLLLAILNLDGKGKNFPDEAVCNRVKALKGPMHLVTYVSLTCTNCPEMNESELGYLIYFFEKACAISGYMLGVNPFNQPGVESYKKNMFALLGKPGYEDQKAALEARLK